MGLQEECCKDGAWVENKGVLLTYHFRNVPVDKREPIVTRARELITDAGFNIGNAHCALESKPPVSWDKGRASIYILRTAFGVDWSDRISSRYEASKHRFSPVLASMGRKAHGRAKAKD